jgi:hypothetical protein
VVNDSGTRVRSAILALSGLIRYFEEFLPPRPIDTVAILTMPNPHKTPELTIIEQLAALKSYIPSTEWLGILGITRQTFCQWVRQGELKALRIGNA